MEHYLIEASAGTGKTYAIEQIFARLVLAEVPIEQILVVTFTKAATKDLKTRLRAHVKGDFDKAQIFTIHGFCYRMLKTFAFEAKIHFDLQEESNFSAQRRVIFDFLRSLDSKNYHPFEIQEALKKCKNDVHKLADKLLFFVEKRKYIEGKDILSRLANHCLERYEEKETFSPDDLLHLMKKCLKIPSFVDLVRKSYRAVIIDEFQDTDPVQWEIFQTLFAEVETLYLVGDPKQSIYRFRGADIHTYYKAKETVKNHLSLETNYRSDPALIEDLNRLFVQFPPVKARPDGKNYPFKDKKGALHFFVSDTAENHLSFITEEILYLHEEEGFPLHSIAVLVKDRYQAERLYHFLQEYNIAATACRKESLGFSALKDLVLLLLDLNNIGKLRRVLAGPFFNWNETELRENSLQEMKIFFEEKRAVFEKKGFAHFIRGFRWFDDFEMILEKEAHTQMTPADLLVYLQEMEKQEVDFKTHPRMNEVQILTIHKSKGLEFDIVFALGAQGLKEEDEEEKLRLIYVALTRGKKRVYVPKLLEFNYAPFSHTLLEGRMFQLRKREEKFLEEMPRQIKESKEELLYSFSSLVKKGEKKKIETQDLLPAGKETGIILHSIFEKVFDKDLNIDPWIEKTSLESHKESILRIINKTLALPLIQSIDPKKAFFEAEFVYPWNGNLIKGSIDLLFEKEGVYYILDWKSNLLSDYSQGSLEKEMKEHDYFLQAEIYAAALKKYVKLFDNCSFGGAYYVFLRGAAVYHFMPKGEPWKL